MPLSPEQIEERSVYKRVTEILKEQGHSDPDNASEFDRFSAAMKHMMQQPKPDSPFKRK